MRVVFRVDASSRIGDRSIARCRVLATVLRERGVEIRFVCRAHPDHLIETLTREAFPVTILPASTGTSQESAERAASVMQATDATETIAALNSEKPDWLIVDHRDLDADWEGALRPHASNLLVIDDSANRTHECDVLLHPNDLPDAEVRYQTLAPAACRRLLGSRYLLLDSLGARRVAEYIDPTPVEQLRLRPARPDDVAVYFDWVNDAEVRRQSLNSDPVSWQTHQEWFHGKLNDPDCRMFVLEATALPVGQIRFDLAGDEARIDYSLDRVVRGRRWGAKLVTLGARMLQDAAPIHLRAEVKETNKTSCAVFMHLGFEDQPAPPQGMRVFRSASSRITAAGLTITSLDSLSPG